MPEKKSHEPVSRFDLESMVSQLGEKAEHTPKEKTEVLEEVLAASRRKSRNLLLILVIGIAIVLALAYLAYLTNLQYQGHSWFR